MEFRSIDWFVEVSLEDLMIYALGNKGVFECVKILCGTGAGAYRAVVLKLSIF
jgi:hypothetical protein